MKGEFPLKKRVYKDAEGRAIEFLTERSLCTLWGQHHATLRTYKVECSNPPITIDFNEIKFPEGMSYEEAAEPDYSQREHLPYDGPPGSRRRHGGYNFTGFNEKLQEDHCITQLLVEKYFE